MSSLTSSTSTIPIQQDLFSTHLRCGSDEAGASKTVTDLFINNIPGYKHLPEIKLHCGECIDNGYLHLIPHDLKGYSAVKGKDGYGRPFVAYATFSRSKRITCVNVIFQRYLDSSDITATCFTRGHALGHDQLFSSSPDIQVAEQTILSLLRGKHPYWKLMNT